MSNLVTPDPTVDTAIREALVAFAAMLRTALDAYGLTQSVAFGVDIPDVSPESGPLAVAALASGDHSLERFSECRYRIHVRVHSYLLIAPLREDRATALGTTADWLIPTLRAIQSNQTLGLPFVEAVIPVSWQAFSAAEWAGVAYTGLLVTSDLSIVLMLPAQD